MYCVSAAGTACCGYCCYRVNKGGPAGPPLAHLLLNDFGNDAGADRTAAFADREPQALVHSDRLNQLDLHLDVVARHDHFRALGQVGNAGDISGAEVELRTVAGKERRVASTLFLLEDVDLGLELRVRRNRARLAENLATLDLLALGTAQEASDVVAGLTLVEDLLEHLDAGHDCRGRRLDADDLDGLASLDDALLNAAGSDRATAGDREDILDRHQERLVQVARGLGGVV